MTIGQSADSQIGWAKETTYGEYVPCTHPVGAHQTLTPSIRANVQRIRQTGSSRSARFLLTALKERAFTMDFHVVDGRPLALAMEKMTQVTNTTKNGSWEHVMDPDAHSDKNSLDSFSLEYSNPGLNVCDKYVGCMVNSLSLAGAGLDTPLTASMEVQAKDLSHLAWSERATVTPHTVKPFEQAVCQLQINNQDFDGAVDNFTWRVAHNIQAIPDVAGSTDLIKYCLPGNRDYECSLTVKPNSKTLWEELVAATDKVEVAFLYTRAATDLLEIEGHGVVLPSEGGLEHPAEAGPLNMPITLVMTMGRITVTDTESTFYT